MNYKIYNKNLKNIAIIGLGKVGLPLSVCYASKGFKVIGVDINKKRIQNLQGGKFILHEPKFSTLFQKYQNRITFSTDLEYAIKISSSIFIIVPTPSQKNGNYSLKHILEVCKRISNILRNESEWKLITVISTGIPGSMENKIKPALENGSHKKAGVEFGLCYSPEFVALGNIIDNFFHPDFILIGQSDKKSGKILASIKMQVCDNIPPVYITNFVNAELAKIGSNTFITTKISFANMLARICEKIPGANVDSITSILSADSSIGGKRLFGSIGYSGPCYPRDNIALTSFSQKLGVPADIAKYTHYYNVKQTKYLSTLVKKFIKKDDTVGILGMSYKPNTDVIEESQGMKLAFDLAASEIPTIVYDPLALQNVRHNLKEKVSYADSAVDCINKSDLIIITTPWEEFKHIDKKVWAERNKPLVVIDCWRILNMPNNKNIKYLRLGEYLYS